MKTYSVAFSKTALKALARLDRPKKVLIFNWITEHLDGCTNPRNQGKALSGNHKGLWRYRIGDYRLIADIRDEEILILIVNVGHRREVYR